MENRLMILVENKVISEEIYLCLKDLHHGYFSSHDVQDLNSYQVLMTHLAMGLERIRKGEHLNPLEDFMKTELQSSSQYVKASTMVEDLISAVDKDIPDWEKDYLLLHMINMLEEKKGMEKRMLKIVVGGQIDKAEIAKQVKELGQDRVEVEIKSDLDAAMAMKNGQYDYYIGACNTGGGGALAMAIALLGPDQCSTVSMPGNIKSDEFIRQEVQNNKVAFGFTAQHREQVLPVIMTEILKK